jgi:cytochrome P450
MSRFSPAAAFCFLAFLYIFVKVLVRAREDRKIRRLGKYAHQIQSKVPLGIGFLYSMVKAVKAQKNFEFWRDNIFGASGKWTVETRIMNERTIFTADPRNIKAMLATQFSDYGKGAAFHAMWKDFLGNSIFATDGERWSASRKLIRPQFTRDRLSDLQCFEAHMQTLFQVLDAGGSKLDSKHAEGTPMSQEKFIDIRNLLYRFTFDVSTDFLLGQDVQSLT